MYIKNYISIKKIDECLFSRRHGYIGTVIFNHSIVLRIFGFDLL